MPLTPLDVLQKQFLPARKAGFDPEDVQGFLDQVREAWEAALMENHRLREDLRARGAEIAELEAQGDEIRETLILARRAALDVEGQARREADLIVGEARLEAEQLLAAAHEQGRKAEEHSMRIKAMRLHHIAQLRALLSATGRLLDEVEREAG